MWSRSWLGLFLGIALGCGGGGTSDGGPPDTGTPDAAADTGTPDTGTPDAAADTGAPDAAADTGAPDAGCDPEISHGVGACADNGADFCAIQQYTFDPPLNDLLTGPQAVAAFSQSCIGTVTNQGPCFTFVLGVLSCTMNNNCTMQPQQLADCIGGCTQEELGLGDGCAECYAGVGSCGSINCAGAEQCQCLGIAGCDPTQIAGCNACLAENCNEPFEACSGLPSSDLLATRP